MKITFDRAKVSPRELKYFSAIFVFYSFMAAFPYTARISRYLLTLILIYGLFMLIRSLGQIGDFFKKPLFLPLFLFSSICAVNILLHFRDGLSTFVTNCGQLTVACLYFFVFFLGFSMLDGEERGEILRFSSTVYIFGILVFSVISLVMLLFQYTSLVSINGTLYRIGMNGRSNTNGVISYQLFGIGTSSSILGSICMVAFLVSIVSLQMKGKRYQWFYIVSIVIFLLTLCAANAFTSIFMLMTFAASYVACHYLTSISEFHGSSLVKRVCKLIFLALGAFIAVYVMYYAVQGAEASVINLFERTRVSVCTAIEKLEDSVFGSLSSEPFEPSEAPEISQKPPMLIERDIGTSIQSGRLSIWAAALQKYVEHPIFGVTNENARVYIDNRLYNNLHNAYLSLLVGTGIIGLGLIVIFGISLLIRVLGYISTRSGTEAKHLSLLVSACLAVLAGNLFNGNFVFAPGENYMFLWMFLGEIYSIVYLQSPAMTWEREELKA